MKLFAIIDFQKDFVDGSLGFPGAERLDAGILERAQDAYAGGSLIMVTYDTHEGNYLETREGKALPIPHAQIGTPGWELYGKTGEWIRSIPHISINKSTFGCPPEELLKLPDGITEIEVCGLVTNMCVISNVCCLQARYPEAQITVYSNRCDSFAPALHNKTIDILEGIQVNVINTNANKEEQ